MEQFEIEFTVKSKVKKQFTLPFFCKIGPNLYGLFENLICEDIYLSDTYFNHTFCIKDSENDFQSVFESIQRNTEIHNDEEFKILSNEEYFELREEMLQNGKDLMFNKNLFQTK